MKFIYTAMALIVSLVARGQDNGNAFEEAFEDMFQYEEPVFIPQNTPPDLPVPLDGGLVALLAAGGAVAYKKYQSKRSNRPN
jgi:hypothetical protein